jgi:hypothetical protein
VGDGGSPRAILRRVPTRTATNGPCRSRRKRFISFLLDLGFPTLCLFRWLATHQIACDPGFCFSHRAVAIAELEPQGRLAGQKFSEGGSGKWNGRCSDSALRVSLERIKMLAQMSRAEIIEELERERPSRRMTPARDHPRESSGFYFLNWKLARWALPSFNRSTNCRQIAGFAQALLVFQA